MPMGASESNTGLVSSTRIFRIKTGAAPTFLVDLLSYSQKPKRLVQLGYEVQLRVWAL